MRLSGDQAGGTNSGSITLAMNRTVISGTPRTISMNPTERNFTAGMRERRPSASRMPSGSETTMPTLATPTVTRMPPHRERARRKSKEKKKRYPRHQSEKGGRPGAPARRAEPQQPSGAETHHHE